MCESIVPSRKHGDSRSGIEAGRDRLRPVCQPWGGPRALNGRWSNEFGSLAAADHCNTSVNKRGARMSARIGRISAPARLIFAQMAQKSPASPAGFFCGDDGGTSAEASPVSAAAHAAEPPLNLPTCTWPNERKSWHASAKNASHVAISRFDRNQLIAIDLTLSRCMVSNRPVL